MVWTILVAGLPEGLAGVVAAASVVVLVLLLAALGGMLYRHLTGGIEWPTDVDEEEDDEVRKSHQEDDEWKFY